MPYSDGFLQKSGANASSTDFRALYRSRLSIDAPDLLQIGVPDLRTFVVCMTYFMTHHGFFAADLANS